MRENLLNDKHIGGLVGHFGYAKTLEELQHFYYFPNMRRDVKIFVRRCKICQYAKGRSEKVSLYTPLPIPWRPYNSIGIDFILGISS